MYPRFRGFVLPERNERAGGQNRGAGLKAFWASVRQLKAFLARTR